MQGSWGQVQQKVWLCSLVVRALPLERHILGPSTVLDNEWSWEPNHRDALGVCKSRTCSAIALVAMAEGAPSLPPLMATTAFCEGSNPVDWVQA